MPQFKIGNMWTAYEQADLFLITTNSTIRRDGALVMGRGIARQARDHFPGLAGALGRRILGLCGNQGEYGLLVSPCIVFVHRDPGCLGTLLPLPLG